jgi:hypothetical protein
MTVRRSNPGGGAGEVFLTRPDLYWGSPSLLYIGYRVFPGGKAAGVWRWPATPSSAGVKGVQLYIYKFVGTNSKNLNQVKCGPAFYQVQLFRRTNGPQRKGATVSCSVYVYWQIVQDRKCRYNVTLWRVCLTFVVVATQQCILCVPRVRFTVEQGKAIPGQALRFPAGWGFQISR